MKRLLVALLFIPSIAFAQTETLNIKPLEDDKFSKTIEFTGSVYDNTSMLLGALGANGEFSRRYFIRGWINKETHAVDYQLYVSIIYNDAWRFYDSANDQEANSLNFVKIDSDVISCAGASSGQECSHSETFGISFTPEYLKKMANTGFQVKVYSKSGQSDIINVFSRQIRSALLTANQGLPEDKQWQDTYPQYVKDIGVPEIGNYSSWSYSEPLIVKNNKTIEENKNTIIDYLTSNGWVIYKNKDNEITTEAKIITPDKKDVKCGFKSGGFNLVKDKHVKVKSYIKIKTIDNISISYAVSGLFTSLNVGEPENCYPTTNALIQPLFDKLNSY